MLVVKQRFSFLNKQTKIQSNLADIFIKETLRTFEKVNKKPRWVSHRGRYQLFATLVQLTKPFTLFSGIGDLETLPLSHFTYNSMITEPYGFKLPPDY